MEYKSLLHTLGWFGGCRQVFFNIQEKMSHLWRLQMSTCPVKAVSEAVTIQDRFMVLWNTRKSLLKIWQCFSCLFSAKKMYEIEIFMMAIWVTNVQLFWEGHKNLRYLPHSLDVYLVNVITIFLVCPQKSSVEFPFLTYFWIPCNN